MGIPLLPPKDKTERQTYGQRLAQLRAIVPCDETGKATGETLTDQQQRQVRSWCARNGWSEGKMVGGKTLITVQGPGVKKGATEITVVTAYFLADLA